MLSVRLWFHAIYSLDGKLSHLLSQQRLAICFLGMNPTFPNVIFDPCYARLCQVMDGTGT